VKPPSHRSDANSGFHKAARGDRASAGNGVLICGLAVFGIVALTLMFIATPEQRAVALPATIATGAVTGMFLLLWHRDRMAPLFDIGAICAGVTLIYVALPPIFFLLGGLQWTDLSDSRLWSMNPSAEEFGTFLWLPVTYLIGFVLIYPLVRGAGTPGPEIPTELPKDQAWIIALIVVWAFVYRMLIEHIYSVDLDPSYREMNPGIGFGYEELPLILQQMTHNILAIGQVGKLALVVFLISSWRNRWARLIVVAWLSIEISMTILHQGARTATALLLMGAILAYHRFVRPFTFSRLVILALTFLGGLITYGFIRSFSALSGQIDTQDFFSAANEFQILVGTAMHVAWLDARGLLGQVPWQIYFSDLINLVPQQLLPFEKIDPSNWYLDVSGLGYDVGLMFGVSAQGVIGGGPPEMFLRGGILALLLGLLHRFYVGRASSYWLTLCYLFLAVHIYYSYRSTSFYWIYYLVYRFMPFFLVVHLASAGFRRASGLRSSSSATRPAEMG
jgi:hypothetical protein